MGASGLSFALSEVESRVRGAEGPSRQSPFHSPRIPLVCPQNWAWRVDAGRMFWGSWVHSGTLGIAGGQRWVSEERSGFPVLGEARARVCVHKIISVTAVTAPKKALTLTRDRKERGPHPCLKPFKSSSSCFLNVWPSRHKEALRTGFPAEISLNCISILLHTRLSGLPQTGRVFVSL